MTERVKALRRAWLRAADDLGIRVSVEGVAREDGQAPKVTYAVLVEDFGSPQGTLVWPTDELNSGQTETASEQGYAFSYLTDAYESYDRDLFVDTLNDWSWSGTSEPPAWYTGAVWDSRGDEYDPATYDPLKHYHPPPGTFYAFLGRIFEQIPEFRPVVEEQIRLSDADLATPILDAVSTAAMAAQKRVLEGKPRDRDEAVVETWLQLAEEAMADPYVADVFLQTAGDDFLWDPSGPSLLPRLGPTVRSKLQERNPEMFSDQSS